MTIRETYKLKVLQYVRVKYDTGALDGIVIENDKDCNWIRVFFPMDETLSTVDRDQIYKAGKVLECDFNKSGLWD